MIQQIPVELHSVRQWTYSYAVDDKKRPKHSHYTTNGSLPLLAAKQKAGDFKYVGFYVTLKDPYFLGDIDHVLNPDDPAGCLPIAVVDLLLNKGLYVERSPSGKGIRFIGRFESTAIKEQFDQSVFYIRNPQENSRENQINIGPPWMTITGDKLPYSSSHIPILSIEDLSLVYQLNKDEDLEIMVVEPRNKEESVEDNRPIPSFQEFKDTLYSIPLDKNPRIMRAAQKVFDCQKTDYDFWLNVLMASHDYACRADLKAEVLHELCQWSMNDDKYDGEEPIMMKWLSFDKEKHKPLSYHTLFALAHQNRLNYPRVKPLTKGQKAAGVRRGQPLNTEYINFQALTEFFDLKLYRDSNNPAKLYVSGDSDILDKYFQAIDITSYYDQYRGIFVVKTLTAAFHIFCQEHGFLGIGHSYVQQHIRNWAFQISREINLVKIYFDTPFAELPEEYQENKNFWGISTTDDMFNCLTIDYLTPDHTKELELYRRYYHCWLMGLARNLYFNDSLHMNNCVLLLTGREQIRKTSHFKFMLPRFMRDEQIAFTTHGFASEQAVRDVVKISASNSLLVWDEVERYLNQDTESNFKMIIDNNPQKFIDKYEVIESVFKPVSIYGATSNKREFKLSDTGSRRIFHIPVSWVDTDTLDKICWHRIVNDLKAEIAVTKGGAPWLLTDSELLYQDQLHGRITAKTGFELLLSEIFNWEEKYAFDCVNLTLPFDYNFNQGKHFLTTKQISQMITMHTSGSVNPSRPALTQTLKRMCGRWTNTKGMAIYCTKPKIRVNTGMATYSNRMTKWVVPSLSTEYTGVIPR